MAYAENLGLKPHPDYRAARMIFGDIDPATATELFEMGMNGKPYFMSGPFQSPAECQAIIAKLTANCGKGGFNYTMAVSPEDLNLSGADWDQLSFEGEDEDSDEASGNEAPARLGVRVVDPHESRQPGE